MPDDADDLVPDAPEPHAELDVEAEEERLHHLESDLQSLRERERADLEAGGANRTFSDAALQKEIDAEQGEGPPPGDRPEQDPATP